ncbi:uncharacterized protein LOC117194083 [Drosophila miranda]|uniref:uncharacterized protein LOC117194083 n=1 Tax=Drosophila miranda TaxID=7229 RepID=UPI00143F7F69|nr:uncharacterized protein LOC117194083 [Drosophila miranda]
MLQFICHRQTPNNPKALGHNQDSRLTHAFVTGVLCIWQCILTPARPLPRRLSLHFEKVTKDSPYDSHWRWVNLESDLQPSHPRTEQSTTAAARKCHRPDTSDYGCIHGDLMSLFGV